jgi:predicted metal-dependent hydrolase
VIEDAVARVRLNGDYLTVSLPDVSDKTRIGKLVTGWYRSHSRRVFEERLSVCFPRVEPLGIAYPEIAVREMKLRWGSCTAGGRILLNVKLIQVPKDLIDYVIIHELCHLKEHNHSPAFYVLLDRVLPDWRERRVRLNKIELR